MQQRGGREKVVKPTFVSGMRSTLPKGPHSNVSRLALPASPVLLLAGHPLLGLRTDFKLCRPHPRELHRGPPGQGSCKPMASSHPGPQGGLKGQARLCPPNPGHCPVWGCPLRGAGPGSCLSGTLAKLSHSSFHFQSEGRPKP